MRQGLIFKERVSVRDVSYNASCVHVVHTWCTRGAGSVRDAGERAMQIGGARAPDRIGETAEAGDIWNRVNWSTGTGLSWFLLQPNLT
jgi:hypothetical protein